MTANWGKTPPDLITKLERLGIDDPDDLPSQAELEKKLGTADARALREELRER